MQKISLYRNVICWGEKSTGICSSRSMGLMDSMGCGRNVPDTVRLAKHFKGKVHIVEMMCLEVMERMDQNSHDGPERAKYYFLWMLEEQAIKNITWQN